MSEYYYRAATGGFYRESAKALYEASSDGWPEDVIAISDDVYKALFEGQAKGKTITSDSSGKPILEDSVIDWQARAKFQRQSLLSEANITIADWRTELQLDVISDDDKASLIKWMAYIKALKALDFTNLTDEESYKAILWPDKP